MCLFSFYLFPSISISDNSLFAFLSYPEHCSLVVGFLAFLLDGKNEIAEKEQHRFSGEIPYSRQVGSRNQDRDLPPKLSLIKNSVAGEIYHHNQSISAQLDSQTSSGYYKNCSNQSAALFTTSNSSSKCHMMTLLLQQELRGMERV